MLLKIISPITTEGEARNEGKSVHMRNKEQWEDLTLKNHIFGEFAVNKGLLDHGTEGHRTCIEAKSEMG
jgi:hypothetical protein